MQYVFIVFLLLACAEQKIEIPSGKVMQAVTITGDTLFSNANPSEKLLANLELAKKDFEVDQSNIDNLIWHGRRVAYTGHYLAAIDIYSQGIKQAPDDARLYRHRGHRYLSTRQLTKAMADFKFAAQLQESKEDQIEPDGLPNARNIPTSTLQTNIYYHLALAYYLKGDLKEALEAYKACLERSKNADMLVATTHWMWMTLQRLNKAEEAVQILEPITNEMDIIENTNYYYLCRFYKGLIPLDSLQNSSQSTGASEALNYGIGNYYFINGEIDNSYNVFKQIIDTGNKAAFGYMGAEIDYDYLESRKNH